MARKRSRQSGMTLMYTAVALTALTAFCSLAVDLGHVQMVKTQLERTADAAARYAAGGVLTMTTATV